VSFRFSGNNNTRQSFARPVNSIVRSQRGAALILALLVVVIVTLLASTLGSDFLVTYKRVENQLLSKQAFALLRGAEGIARSTLQTDLQLGKDVDHASEGWLNVQQEFPLDQGMISGTLCDLQGRFNLNSLSGANSAGEFTFTQAIFVRLLQSITFPNGELLDQQQAESINNAIGDWIDSDSEERENGGAENNYYGDLEVSYRSANRKFLSVSELLWVKGIDEAIFKALEPHVTALPDSAVINVNTAGSVIIRSINALDDLQPISESETEAIINARDSSFGSTRIAGSNYSEISGFSAVSDFIEAHPAESLDGSGLGIDSAFFLLDATIQFLDRKFRMYSVLYRDQASGKITTIARASNGLGKCYAFSAEDDSDSA